MMSKFPIGPRDLSPKSGAHGAPFLWTPTKSSVHGGLGSPPFQWISWSTPESLTPVGYHLVTSGLSFQWRFPYMQPPPASLPHQGRHQGRRRTYIFSLLSATATPAGQPSYLYFTPLCNTAEHSWLLRGFKHVLQYWPRGRCIIDNGAGLLYERRPGQGSCVLSWRWCEVDVVASSQTFSFPGS